MATYVILSRLSHESVRDIGQFKRSAATVAEAIRSQCPNVKWKDSYAVLGRFDVIDVLEADDVKDVEKAAMLIRTHGHATTETLQATPWKEFLDTI
jgi:uncharacterized protein with GYD domain